MAKASKRKIYVDPPAVRADFARRLRELAEDRRLPAGDRRELARMAEDWERTLPRRQKRKPPEKP